MPALTHRLSHKFSSTFGHPTVVHRTSMKSRPSVHSIREGPEASCLANSISPQDLSAASTYNSFSGSSPAQVSTNPTSDCLSISPTRSPPHHPPCTDNSRLLTFNRDLSASRLTPIDESPDIVVPSIITVEATAAAKIFFETHFKQILSFQTPRMQRARELEVALETCKWSPAKRLKARAAFIRHENEFLRKDRVLKSRANAMKNAKGVSIAGYDVVKVLGKGSFGVVRLVKDKTIPSQKPSVETNPEPSKRSSRTDLASLRSTARDAFPLLGSRRKELTKFKKEVYAMKVIRKSDMLRNCQEGHLRAERDFLVASENSRWIVPLIAAFQDRKNLYLVMDYCVGGDFLSLLIRRNTLTEDVTRWYIAEMILCVEEAHSLRWIHRDVKPDNFLIGADGHLKISDFGLAFDGHWSHDQSFFHQHRHSLIEKLAIEVQGDDQDKEEAHAAEASRKIGNVMTEQSQPLGKAKAKEVAEERAEDEPVVDWREKNQRRKLARSVVGTSQYMAPEVIRGELYDGRCDWWSIGIILYECLFGITPFTCESRQQTKLKILKHRSTLCFPDDQYGFPSIGSEVLDLMRRLLREKEERLSSPKYYLNDYAYSQAQDGNTYHIYGLADKASKNYQGKHVYSDDADDIKAHPWFKNIDWTQIHKKKPPFIPKVKDWEDTRYFDNDETISDVSSSSSEGNEEEAAASMNKENMPGTRDMEGGLPDYKNTFLSPANMDYRISGHHAEDQHIVPSQTREADDITRNHNPNVLHAAAKAKPQEVGPIVAAQTQPIGGALMPPLVPEGVRVKKPKKEKKRPRDKILRDPSTATIAMDIRRQGAFWGYGYRRPKGIQSVLDKVEAEAKAEKMSGISGGDRVVKADPRRDSAIAGIEPPERRTSGLGAGDRARAETETRRMAKPRAGAPSPRCITPVDNGMDMGVGMRRIGGPGPRFGIT